MRCSDIRYVRSGDVAIAYQIIGEGTTDLVFVTGFVSNLAYAWEHPIVVRFYERVSSFSRLIRFDRRGTGLSDRPRDVPTLETRMDDLRAVMTAVGSERAAVLATFEAAPMAALFAATYPERVGALILFNPYAKAVASSGYPWGKTAEEWRHDLAEIERGWGTEEYFDTVLHRSYGSLADDESWRCWFMNMMRYGASPGAALTVHRMAMEIDVRDVLPAVRVPTLILHGPRNRGHATYMAERIPGARRVELDGGDSSVWLVDDVPEQTGRFVHECWGTAEPDTVLTTVLFTDIVGSTERTVVQGDRAWARTLGEHHAVVRGHLDRFRGREMDTAGDGFFATFDGPLRAIRCADAVTRSLREIGIDIRAGIHTGECEIVGDKVGGLAVNIGARVAAKAEAGEILVSQTVRDLVAGSGLLLKDRGVATLKGVPGEWRLYAVADAASPTDTISVIDRSQQYRLAR
ncbi:MAG TPA: adenylate/guanylate cyclase domain-containing protein [Gaiellaceae bacterium]